MKLLNNTPIPDAILEPLLRKAGRAVGARTQRVVVQVNRATSHVTSCGMAYSATWVRWKGGSNRKLTTDKGAFKISLPLRSPTERPHIKKYRDLRYDPLTVAQRFFAVARHEWGHIREYQTGDYWRLPNSKRHPVMDLSGRVQKAKRRIPHDARPEEIRVENYAWDADEKGKDKDWAAEEIQALAIALRESGVE